MHESRDFTTHKFQSFENRFLRLQKFCHMPGPQEDGAEVATEGKDEQHGHDRPHLKRHRHRLAWKRAQARMGPFNRIDRLRSKLQSFYPFFRKRPQKMPSSLSFCECMILNFCKCNLGFFYLPSSFCWDRLVWTPRWSCPGATGQFQRGQQSVQTPEIFKKRIMCYLQKTSIQTNIS